MTSISAKTPYYSPWFLAKLENFDFGKKGYHQKEHLKRNRMTQILASWHLPVRSYEHKKKSVQKPWTIVHGYCPDTATPHLVVVTLQ